MTLQTGKSYIEVVLLQQGMQGVQFNHLNRTIGKRIQVHKRDQITVNSKIFVQT